ncbi:nuclear pore complex protein DDB_G0274915-like isoform X2 [Mya arenaria]|uniref:nuclear pore complex protein DDB_G0274915-like isoform X2 n=1 Tax=Mya arenaria TaxID=6604 RepID=UPI0022E5B0F6|nr:nuclear pore complex protein DDB_G0274915-like isoform X2 [Mya arenaria]
MNSDFIKFSLFSFCFGLILLLSFYNIAYALILIGTLLILFHNSAKYFIQQFYESETESGKAPGPLISNFIGTQSSDTPQRTYVNLRQNGFYLDFNSGQVLNSGKMWNGRQRNTPVKPKLKYSSQVLNPLNSTMPVLSNGHSPLTSRHGISTYGGMNQTLMNSPARNSPAREKSVSAANPSRPGGPLLSSPFMPQIKRALGLEPSSHHQYREPRRHGSIIGTDMSASTTRSPQTAGALPLVRLNPIRRHSLTERNSSMLNRSNTVKIAPPVAGKISSPSFSQVQPPWSDDRFTPDTHAVISALKERRKRSMNIQEEPTADTPIQQAKRRRQESQHSNSSTSSIPLMPDVLPDLTGADYGIRLETPVMKRPSRPSQDSPSDDPAMKRICSEGRNNSILSSLSSSQRIKEKQKSKRKADSSFTEKENGDYSVKYQRQQAPERINEPPKLSHLDVSYDQMTTPRRQELDSTATRANKGEKPAVSEILQDSVNVETPKKLDFSKPPTLRNMPSMKKTASVYSGLSSKTNFKQAQYANVVATLDDYDSDRDTENERVQQMLKNIDETFAKKEQNAAAASATTSAVTSTVPTVSTATVTIATTSSIATTQSTGSVLSALGEMTKSPVQETGGVTTSGSAPPAFKSLLPASTAVTSLTSTGLSTGAAGQSLGSLLATTPAISSQPSLSTATPLSSLAAAATTIPAASTEGSTSPKFKPLFGSVQPVAPQVSSTPTAGFNLGSQASSAPTGFVTGVGFGLTTSINSLSTPAATVPATGTGIGFGLASAPASTATPSGLTIPATGFSFGVGSASTTTTTSLAAPSISFGTAPSTRSPTPAAGLTFCSTASGTPSTGLTFGSTTQSSTPSTGLTFGLTAQSSTPATGLTFGFTTQSSTPATGLTFGSTALDTPAAGLTFGSTTQSITPAAGFSFGTAVSSAVTTLASLSQPGFSFGATASTSAPVSAGNQTGFSFGVGQSGTTALSSAAFQIGSQQTTTTAAPTFSFGSSAPPAATTAATAGFSFGAQTSGTAPPAYGSIATTNPSQTPFGAPTATQTPFGAQTSTTSAPGFNFGASQTTTGSASPFSFAAGPTASTAGSSVFGTQPASTASTPFAFGQGTGPTTTASAQTFNFGGSTQSGLGFGSSSNTAAFGLTTNQPPAFGSSTNQPPAFGAAVNPAPAFGTGSASQTPAFNFGATANPTPAFGATSNPTPAFGATNPTPAFGATSNQTPAFGATNPTPAFGATPNQVPAFGSTNPAPAFGGFGATTTQKSNTPVFGASTNNTGSVFGSTNAPGFSKSQSMPVFATTATGGGPFGNTAPNVNPFGTGQTTPAKQTGNAFGQTNLDSTPKSQTGAMFQFGQSNNNSSAAKGFDFGSSAGSSSQNNAGAGFNFMASANSFPDFNFGATGATPTQNPSFGTPAGTPSFSMGANETAPRPPRVMARGSRRRGNRK